MFKVCRKEQCLRNNDKIILKTKDWNKNNPGKLKQNQKNYMELNKAKRNVYLKNKRETDVKLRLISNTRMRIYKSLKSMLKQSSTKKIWGIDVDTYRKRIEWQMTPEMNWSCIENDHVKAICMFDLSKDQVLNEALSWKNTEHLLKHDHQLKGINFFS